MNASKNISLTILILVLLASFAHTAELSKQAPLQVERQEKEYTKMLQWVDEQAGQKLFDIGDIVRFDWHKQIFELTRQSAMDFMASLHSVGVEGRTFILKGEDQFTIYKGTLVNPASSFTFVGPVIGESLSDDNVKPPLFEIGGGYPRDFTKADTRFSERFKEALQQADVLSEIDVNNPPLPIKRIAHGWFGDKKGLRALIEVFPETFRLYRSGRVHIHLTGGKDLNENHVFDVNATLISKNGRGRFLTKTIFPFHSDARRNICVFQMNPWGPARQSTSGRVKPGGAKLSIEVFTRSILDEQENTYSEPIDRVKTDAIDVWIEPGRPLLPEIAEKAIIGFQKALRESDWAKALTYCSKKVKTEAVGHESIEAFFGDVLPIEEIKSLPEFQIRGRGIRNDEVVRYSCEIKLEDPNYRWPLNWNLSVLKEDSSWAVEFPTKPLDIWLKHEVLKSKWANGELKFDKEKIRKGFEVSLVPLSEDYVIGKPMLFRLEMKNVSTETLGPVDTTSVMVNDPMIVIHPNGDKALYVDSDYQTVTGHEFVEPGETIVIADNYDARSQYHITTPGKYTFQFRGWFTINPSDSVEIDIKAGRLSSLETVVEKLLPILPEGWTLTRTRIGDIADLDCETDRGIVVRMVGRRGRKGGSGGMVGVFVLINPSQSFLEKTQFEAELWGQSQWGSVYVKSLDAEQLWSDYEAQIIKAFDIQKPIDNADVHVESKD